MKAEGSWLRAVGAATRYSSLRGESVGAASCVLTVLAVLAFWQAWIEDVCGMGAPKVWWVYLTMVGSKEGMYRRKLGDIGRLYS